MEWRSEKKKFEHFNIETLTTLNMTLKGTKKLSIDKFLGPNENP